MLVQFYNIHIFVESKSFSIYTLIDACRSEYSVIITLNSFCSIDAKHQHLIFAIRRILCPTQIVRQSHFDAHFIDKLTTN